MSKKQIFIISFILICALVGTIYYAWLGSIKSAFLENEITKLKTEISGFQAERENLLRDVTNLQEELEEKERTTKKADEVENIPSVVRSGLNIDFLEPIRIITHDGYIDPAPHTIEALQKALDLGVYGIEIDVQFTKDHIPVLLDEPNMGGDINCTELTLKELKNYKINGRYDIPTLEEALEFLNGKIDLLVIDTTYLPLLPESMEVKDIPRIIQETISKKGAENFAVIQTANPDFLELIDFNKYKVAWNTVDIQKDYKISFYTLNPAWYVTPEKIKEIRDVGAEVIGVNVAYAGIEAEERQYANSLLSGLKYIMVDYVENFIDFSKKYEIPIYGE